MLELTLNTGTELKIGDDIRIVFRGDTASGRLKVAVEAPKEKRIERVRSVDEPEQKESRSSVARSGSAQKGKVVIVRNQGSLSGNREKMQ